MKITAIGSGSAFTLNNYQSNFLVETEGRRLLVDCGSDARFALKEMGLSYKDIDAVYISHLHADHAGGLEWLGFAKFFDPTQKPPDLFISELLKDSLWNNVLSGGMSTLQNKICHLDTFFNVNAIPLNEGFSYMGTEFRLIQTCHFMNGYYISPSFGLIFEPSKSFGNVFITTDTQFAPEQISDFYNSCNLILHDCETMYLPNKVPIKSRVHAHYEDLKTISPEVKGKMWLYHYQDNGPEILDCNADGFLGFVKKGQEFEF